MNKFYIISDINKYKFFKDYIESLISKLNNVFKIISQPSNINKWCVNQIKSNQDESYYIFANWNYKVLSQIEYTDNIYIINFEQLSRDNILDEVINLSKKFKIINYSLENHRLMNSNNSIYIPYQFNCNEIFNYKKIFNVCFIGCFSPYRKGVLNNKILKNNIKIINKFGKERDQEIFKFKIILNIHYNKEYNILEEIRINRCIFNKVIVISETSENMNKYYLKDHMIF